MNPTMSDNENYVPEGTLSTQSNDKLDVVARKVVRFIMSQVESQNTILSRAKLMDVVKNASQQENATRIRFDDMFTAINNILFDVYGYELKGLRNRPVTSQTSATTINATEEIPDHKASQFLVLNNLPFLRNFDELKILQSVRTYEDLIQNGEYTGDDMGAESVNTFASKLNVDQDLAYNGILSVILCIILFSSNHILHQDLLKQMEKFGIPTDGTAIPIVQLTIDDLLKTLERRQYIVKLEEKSDVVGDVVLYRIGRRTQAEFDQSSLVQLVREVMGVAYDDTIKHDIRKIVGDAYA
ncbi:hypothetical protein KAFR_0E01440 [Kazachstania africana CBS 2517]|uniref:MAGE domain-containing protein n=1 Tax=Kazachstania africana (strain ATCC 22294 / BCRC 22015 / CBS 2517 / CECT 1963 / NBRC 1671 / NRRL Y-8276) TaxID=1071382 RepID=H2AV98_KAZAF|nr:hypothetical protein KAFR_0E01440 [Kazachstania africana CBS 2517]CCF58298.1 hypothetical protein KAFR_0E01440 [Kazachstania africana CBS 2517]